MFTRWWNRARPLTILQGFADILNNRSDADVPPDLTKLTRPSWNIETIPSKATLGELRTARGDAGVAQRLYGIAAEKLPDLTQRFAAAATDDAAIEVLREMMSIRGISEAISICLKRQDITIAAPLSAPAGDIKLPVVESSDNSGCYIIVWKAGTSNFSSELTEQPFLKPRLEPFVESLRHVDKGALTKVFESVYPLLQREATAAAEIQRLASQIVDENGRWAGKVLLANYGAAPMIVWPDATLVVTSKASKPFKIACYLAIESHDEVTDLAGVHVIAPGEKAILWVVTKQVQREIPGGHLLRALYTANDAVARIDLKITRRGALWGNRVRSTSGMFQSNVRLPEPTRRT